MKIKTKAIALCGIAALTLLSGAAAVKSIDRTDVKNDTVIAGAVAAESKSQYYLRDCDGYIAVFADMSSDTPLTVTDIEIGMLTDTDKTMLKNGIAAENKAELLKLLEDFSS